MNDRRKEASFEMIFRKELWLTITEGLCHYIELENPQIAEQKTIVNANIAEGKKNNKIIKSLKKR